MKIGKWRISNGPVFRIADGKFSEKVQNIYIISSVLYIVIAFAIGSLLTVEPHWHARPSIGICALIWPCLFYRGVKSMLVYIHNKYKSNDSTCSFLVVMQISWANTYLAVQKKKSCFLFLSASCLSIKNIKRLSTFVVVPDNQRHGWQSGFYCSFASSELPKQLHANNMHFITQPCGKLRPWASKNESVCVLCLSELAIWICLDFWRSFMMS